MPHTPERSSRRQIAILCGVFFVSGFPALLYQLVWQRALFSIYGVNIESVTMVVTAFMLGLGLGSLVGGALSKRSRIPLLPLFGIVELSIGAFGWISLDVFEWVGRFTVGVPALQTGAITFVLVLIPTLFMGATLPLLVTHLVRHGGNVGRSVGLLYFVNTIGSSVACFAAATLLMGNLGMRGTVSFAVLWNFAAAVAVLLLAYFGPRTAPQAATAPAPESTPAARTSTRFWLAVGLGAMAGYVSLSYEILWVRAYSVTTGGLAGGFALVLGSFLLGIALGSLLSRRFCPDAAAGSSRHLRAVAIFVLAANLLGYLVVPSIAEVVRHATFFFTLPLVVIAAAALGAIFPLVTHFGVDPDAGVGAGVSYLYLANIAGSSLGSFLTGFVLMDHFGIGAISTGLAIVGTLMALAVYLLSGEATSARRPVIVGAAATVVLLLLGQGPLFSRVYEKLQLKRTYEPGDRFADVIETKSGVITVTDDKVIYGGGIYDGRFSIDLVKDRNRIIRAYATSVLHPYPKHVLEIGLSSGSWAQVLANIPSVEDVTIVEINPGYVELIRKEPIVASLLDNPKVTLVVDDGRRWMAAHPERKFDAIVMNSTYHWRDHASSLLSVEFLELARARLADGGFLIYNTTDSDRVLYTGVSVFAHAMRVSNFLAVSDTPFDLDKERWRTSLTSMRIDGKPVFDLEDARHRDRLEEVIALIDEAAPEGKKGKKGKKGFFEHERSMRARLTGITAITDDNMGTEWGYAEALESGAHASTWKKLP